MSVVCTSKSKSFLISSIYFSSSLLTSIWSMSSLRSDCLACTAWMVYFMTVRPSMYRYACRRLSS